MAEVLCQSSKSWQRTLPEVLAFRQLNWAGLPKWGFWGDRELAKSFPGVKDPKLRKTLETTRTQPLVPGWSILTIKRIVPNLRTLSGDPDAFDERQTSHG